MHIKIISLFFFGLMLTGCTYRSQTPSSGQIINPQGITATPEPIQTIQPPPTVEMTVPTIQEITNTPMLYPGFSNMQKCTDKGSLEINSDYLNLPGTIFFQKPTLDGIYGVNNQTGIIKPIYQSANRVVSFGLSPNEQWFAYAPEESQIIQDITVQTPKIVLMNSLGEKIVKELVLYPLEDLLEECCSDKPLRGLWKGEWITNDLLYVEVHSSDDLGGMVCVLPAVLNPFTLEWKKQWFSDLPGQYTGTCGRFKSHELKISPDTSAVLYPLNEGGIVLHDLNLGKRIYIDKDFDNVYSELIDWSPDSQYVAVANMPNFDSLFVISKSGQPVKIADDKNPIQGLMVTSLSWSPDSRYLGIGGLDINGQSIFLLFDQRGNEYLLNCQLNGLENWVRSIVWSPNSNWVALSSVDAKVKLLNVAKREIFEFKELSFGVGWSGSHDVFNVKP